MLPYKTHIGKKKQRRQTHRHINILEAVEQIKDNNCNDNDTFSKINLEKKKQSLQSQHRRLILYKLYLSD